MSTKNFVSYGDSETLFTGVGNKLSTLKSGLTTLDNEVNGDATTYPYADVITISDAVPSNLAECNVKIEPVQDLHGYDHPWVGGANKNKINIADKASSTSGDVTASCSNGVITLSGTATKQTTFTFPLGSDIVMSPSLYKIAYNNTAATSYISVKFCNNGYVVHSWTPNVINRVISDWTAAKDETINEIKIEIANGYSTNMTLSIVVMDKNGTDTSFAPYENICPITGHTEASVQRDRNDVWTGNDSYIIATAGHIIPNTTIALPAGKYALDFEASNPSGVFEFEVFKGNSVDWANRLFDKVFTAKARNIVEFTLTEASTNLILYSSDGASISNVRLYSTVQTYTILFKDAQGQTITVYGSDLNVKNGTLTVDRATKTFDGSESWLLQEKTHNYFNTQNVMASDVKASSTLLANEFEDVVITGSNENIGIHLSDTNKLQIRYALDNNLTVSDLQTFLGENPLQLCYELATPTTIQLTPQQIQLLKGTNTLTASTGQISVTVNGVSGAIGSLQTQANATDEALAELAAKLPTAPTTNGAYVLTVTVADGTPTYSWESAT